MAVMRDLFRWSLVLLVTVLLGACATPDTPPPPPPEEVPNVRLPARVAILPFDTESMGVDGQSVRQVFYNYFSSLHYIDVELATVDQAIDKQSVSVKDLLADTAKRMQLCNRLGVDGLITGEVRDYDQDYAVIYTQSTLEIHATLMRCDDGSRLWEDTHAETSRDGDVPLSLLGAAATVVTTFIAARETDMPLLAAQVSAELVAGIPHPPAPARPPPVITGVFHNGNQRLLQPGEWLKVVAVGDPGMMARWQVAGVSGVLPLEERQPGTYFGAHRIGPNDRKVGATLEVTLTNRQAVSARWIEAATPIDIGRAQRIPARIDGPVTLTAQKGPYRLQGLVMVGPKGRLIVEAGTHLWADPGASLVIKGQLTTTGKPGAPVTLRALRGSWKGLVFDATQAPSTLSHTTILHAVTGISIHQASVDITQGHVEHATWGMVIENASVHIRSSRISGARKVGLSARNATVVLEDSRLSQNALGGMQFDRTKVTAKNNMITGNGRWAVRNLDGSATLSLDGNFWGVKRAEDVPVLGPVDLGKLLDTPPSQ